MKTRKSKIKKPVWSGSGESPSPGSKPAPACGVCHTVAGEGSLPVVFFMRTRIWFMRALSPFLIPPLCEFGGTETFGFKFSEIHARILKSVFQLFLFINYLRIFQCYFFLCCVIFHCNLFQASVTSNISEYISYN